MDTNDEPPNPQSEDDGQSVLDYMDECRQVWRARAHQIINDHMDRAKAAADSSPAIRLLIPSIRTTLHDLFDHMVTSPLEYADHQAAIAATEVQSATVPDDPDGIDTFSDEPSPNTGPSQSTPPAAQDDPGEQHTLTDPPQAA